MNKTILYTLMDFSSSYLTFYTSIKKNTLNLVSALLLFIVGQTSVTAQSTVKLTLEDAVSYAQTNSPNADAVRSNRKAALWRYKSFRAGLLPSLSFNGDAPGYNNSINQITLPDGSLAYVTQQQSKLSGTLDLNQSIPYTGGTLKLSSGLDRVFFYNSTVGEWNYTWQSTPLVLTYTQPLFSYNQLKWQLKIQPVQDELSRLQFTENMEDVALNTTSAYFDAYLAKINLESAIFNVGVNDTIYQISKGRFNVGKIAENDLLQSELALLNAQTSMKNAELTYKKAIEDLKIKLGLPASKAIDVDAPESLPIMEIDPELAIDYARKNSSFQTNVKLRELEAEQSLAQAKGNSGLTANINASYGLNQTHNDLSGAYSHPQSRKFFTIGFQIPIVNWGKNNANIQAAYESSKETKKKLEVEKAQYQVDIYYRVNQFLLQQNQVIIAQKSDTIAQRRYEVTQARYLIGKVDITNLQIAQNEKDNARSSLIRAQRDYWTAWYQLRRSTLFDFIKNEPIRYFED